MQGSVSLQGPRGENLDAVRFHSAAATGEDFRTVIQPRAEMDPSPPQPTGSWCVSRVTRLCRESRTAATLVRRIQAESHCVSHSCIISRQSQAAGEHARVAEGFGDVDDVNLSVERLLCDAFKSDNVSGGKCGIISSWIRPSSSQLLTSREWRHVAAPPMCPDLEVHVCVSVCKQKRKKRVVRNLIIF